MITFISCSHFSNGKNSSYGIKEKKNIRLEQQA